MHSIIGRRDGIHVGHFDAFIPYRDMISDSKKITKEKFIHEMQFKKYVVVESHDEETKYKIIILNRNEKGTNDIITKTSWGYKDQTKTFVAQVSDIVKQHQLKPITPQGFSKCSAQKKIKNKKFFK